MRALLLVALAVLAIPTGKFVGWLATEQIEAPRRKLAAESEKELADARAEAALRLKASREQDEIKFAIIREALKALRHEYADAVNRDDPAAAAEAFRNLMSMAIKPIMTPQEATARAQQACKRIAAYRELAREAGNRGDYASMLALANKVDEEIAKMRGD